MQFTALIDISINADWPDWQNYPNGRPNAFNSQEAIDWKVNGMAMDYYNRADDSTMGQSAVNAAKSIKAQLQSMYPALSDAELYAKVAITPMIGLNDDYAMFGFGDADTLATFGYQNNLKFLAMWDFNRDNPSSYTYVDLTTSSNPAQRTSGEYSQRFVAAGAS